MKSSHAIAAIFMVDDDPAAQRVMRRILGRSGYNALLANGGQEAFSIEKSNSIIEQGLGNHFDPDVVDAFFSIQDQILDIKDKYQDEKISPLLSMKHMLSDGKTNSVLECFEV